MSNRVSPVVYVGKLSNGTNVYRQYYIYGSFDNFPAALTEKDGESEVNSYPESHKVLGENGYI